MGVLDSKLLVGDRVDLARPSEVRPTGCTPRVSVPLSFEFGRATEMQHLNFFKRILTESQSQNLAV
jgi:hypothetical protein